MLPLIEDIGFEAVDTGDLRIARLLEPLAMLWIHLAHAQGLVRDFAFRLVKTLPSPRERLSSICLKLGH